MLVFFHRSIDMRDLVLRIRFIVGSALSPSFVSAFRAVSSAPRFEYDLADVRLILYKGNAQKAQRHNKRTYDGYDDHRKHRSAFIMPQVVQGDFKYVAEFHSAAPSFSGADLPLAPARISATPSLI